ncbi:winged helix-turn-helix transcriptional regulator [Cryptosporangium minutisporangium]|uniref:winged helix-turn-helix transcriptional regulator n=1 Tax=Cryptosporangium minutisporangium TaxID=113569 RepID=UPI0035E9502D
MPHVGHQTVSTGWDPVLVPDGRGATRRPEPECPVEVALAAIGGRWTTLVLRDLMGGARSFTELQRGLPTLSAKVLTERLVRLEQRGLVERARSASFPPRTLYRLTAAGRAVEPLLVELYRTGTALLETSLDVSPDDSPR